MDALYRKSLGRIQAVSDSFVRYLYRDINWNDRLICLTGPRGSGKTTLMLQYLKRNLPRDATNLYLSLDDIYFTSHRLVDVAEDFYNRGGRHLFLDEVHKYPDWSIEIKNIYDTYLDLRMVISGSSLLEVDYGKADLSRRLSQYQVHTLSFREYLAFDQGIDLPVVSLDDILTNHTALALDIGSKTSPLAHFTRYLRLGCLPFFRENEDRYYQRLNYIVDVTLETDVPSLVSVDFMHMRKLRQLMYIISQSVPFKPNLVKLAGYTEMDRRTILKYLTLLERAELVCLLGTDTRGIAQLVKPDKVYLAHPNLIYAMAEGEANIGNVRETFFLNQLLAKYKMNFIEQGDFLVNNKYVFEIGGKNKDFSQVKNLDNTYLALDDIAVGSGRKVPLWLFGFLY